MIIINIDIAISKTNMIIFEIEIANVSNLAFVPQTTPNKKRKDDEVESKLFISMTAEISISINYLTISTNNFLTFLNKRKTAGKWQSRGLCY